MKKFIYLICLLGLFLLIGCEKGINVKFDSDGGSAIETQNVTETGIAVEPENPVKTGYAFLGCSSLKEIYVLDSHPSFAVIDGVLYSKDLTRLICCPGGKEGVFRIPDHVTEIFDAAFRRCESLTSIDIPNSVKSIEKWTFCGCSSLTSIEIPDSVKSIRKYTFSGCKSLTSIEIPNSVESIGWEAFSGCSALKEVHSYIEDPSKVQISYLSDFPSRYCTLYVPINTIQAYRTHKVFMRFEKIKPIHPYLKFDETGKIVDGIRKKVTGVVIPEGVTSIGDEAFRECTFLTSIEIPDSVESIGNSAFSGCSSLTSIEIPNSVTNIEDWAFAHCSSLTSIDIPNSVIKIGEDAFSGCSSLKEVYVSESHPCFAVVDGVLYSKDLTQLRWCPTWKQGDFAISNQITVISGGAFDGCSSLTTIVIPNSVESIGGAAFNGCM